MGNILLTALFNLMTLLLGVYKVVLCLTLFAGFDKHAFMCR